MQNEKPTKRRGRPPKAEADRKDGNLTFRTRSGLRDRLAKAAEVSGRSISEEIEGRLERSLDDELVALRQAMFGEPNTEQLVRKIVWAARLIEDWSRQELGNRTGSWADTEETRAAFRRAIQIIAVDATPHASPDGLMAHVLGETSVAGDAIAEAQSRGDAVGSVLTGRLSAVSAENVNLGMGGTW